jgi:hypothetical protein
MRSVLQAQTRQKIILFVGVTAVLYLAALLLQSGSIEERDDGRPLGRSPVQSHFNAPYEPFDDELPDDLPPEDLQAGLPPIAPSPSPTAPIIQPVASPIAPIPEAPRLNLSRPAVMYFRQGGEKDMVYIGVACPGDPTPEYQLQAWFRPLRNSDLVCVQAT